MDELKGAAVIAGLRKKWNQQNVLAYIVFSVAISFFASTVAIKLIHLTWVIVPVILIAVVVVVFSVAVKKITNQDIIKFLNEAYPNLEESSNLLLQPYETLNMLQQLQVSKVANLLSENLAMPPVIKQKTKSAAILLAFALVAGIALYIIPFKSFQQQYRAGAVGSVAIQTRPETKLAQVEDVTIKISPPSYTGKGPREQDRFNVAAEQDADVSWNITTTSKAKDVELIFNDKSVLHLQATDKSRTKWAGGKQVKSSGFYQVKIGNNLSELYQVEMIKDQPPVVVVQSPKPNTVIEYGQPQKVLINVALSDDYGIESTFINATTASGSGEAVKFKEQHISFLNFSPGNKQYQLQKQVDLAALGMQPGDELYFYVNAKDTYHQEKRSDVYIVRMEDTAQLMSMDGLVSGVDVKPEFFRSERQIIIETEQLLKDRDTTSVEIFNKKSSNLGVDQKLLRLRYGKFLGEESETEIGTDEHNSQTQNNPADFNNADKILDQYSHKHDIAEDATFFDAQTKKQLLATLSEMWKAELQLRTLKPREALPFEYKALRLLKDLQQSTRAFVGKTSTKTTPLKPEIRLTGDLTKVTEPVVSEDVQQKADPAVILRKALGILEQVRNQEDLQKSSVAILEQASMQLSAKAAADPSNYLSSLQAMRRILRKNYKIKDVNLAASALQKMLYTVANIPQRSSAAPDPLSQHYFKNLNRKND